MHRIIKHTLYILMFTASNWALAQDIHFTQYHASPLTTNPALTGWFEGNCRVAAIYREQWKAIGDYPYKTTAFSFDRQHRLYTEQVNYGAVLINDQSGAVGLTSSSAILSGGYLKDFAGNKLQAGIQVGVTSTSANTANLTFDSQFDLGEDEIFNSDIASGENIGTNKTFVDFNAGVLWSKQISKNIIPMAGVALFHINRPNTSLYSINESETKIPVKSVFHAETKILIGEKLQAVPSIIYFRQKKATELLLGGTAEYILGLPFLTSVYTGALFRYGMAQNYDAAMGIAGFKFRSFDLGLSYDVNVSQLQEATNNKGALEVSLRYICKSTKVKKVRVSCERL